jgi:hypothetical protein
MAAEFCLRNISIHARKVLLHAVNLHGTDGFTSPPKEVVLRIFITLKNLTLTTSPPRATYIYIHINKTQNDPLQNRLHPNSSFYTPF